MSNHPIIPPPELVQEWWDKVPGTFTSLVDETHLATQAAQWGADQELEACVKWVSKYCPYFGDYPLPEDKLRAARRHKPPSLKEQALSELEEIMTELHGKTGSAFTASAIRRALEALDD